MIWTIRTIPRIRPSASITGEESKVLSPSLSRRLSTQTTPCSRARPENISVGGRGKRAAGRGRSSSLYLGRSHRLFDVPCVFRNRPAEDAASLLRNENVIFDPDACEIPVIFGLGIIDKRGQPLLAPPLIVALGHEVNPGLHGEDKTGAGVS